MKARFDEQTHSGKAPLGVLGAASRAGVAAVVACGRTTLSPSSWEPEGVRAVDGLSDVEPDPVRCMTDAAAPLRPSAQRRPRSSSGDPTPTLRKPMNGAHRSASVKDVAATAGVSLGTVSNVLNRPDRVSPATRERVERAMTELGFVVNESARSLRTGHTQSLAYVMLDARNPFFTDVAQGIEHAAEAAELSLSLCNSDGRAAREKAHLAHLQQQRVQGILITPVDPDDPELDAIVGRGMPLVVVDRTRERGAFCTVSVDDVLGGRLAVEHLIDSGHERVAFVGGPTSIGQVRDRYEGARHAWTEAGLPAEDLVHLPCEALVVAEGRAAGGWLFGLPWRRRPTAAFCANDLVALGLLQHAITGGHRVPDDLAIIGYDDIEFSAAAAVPLTSVRQPRQDLGRRAGELLLDEVTNPDHAHEQVVFTPEIVARASTRR